MGKKAPAPTDPKETSAAQTGTSVATAIANAYLGNVNENTPDGSTTVTQSGMRSIYDPYTGKTYDIPTFTRNTTLSAGQQAIKQQNDAASLNLASLGNTLSGKLGNQLTDNFKLGNEATEARLMELGRARLDPALAQQDEALRTRLANQGIKAGSLAYDREMATQGQKANDAHTQLLLQGRNQANQEILTEDNQRINQISALLNGGQVSQPNFMGTNMPTIPTTDNAGIISNYDQQRLDAWKQQQATMGGILGGVMGLGGKLIGLSEDEAKEDKKRLGDIEGEMGLWEFRYKDEPKGTPKQLGLMASEVEKEKPQAVVRGKDGKRRVDYGTALGLMGYK
ncbi:hypothetical protein O9X81_05190 [Agrobacterium salinitolerans]|uniref:hypothetical protein n=1 Tax=Agrobacterium salinitolerans TaxID=1183413 RepID=UPI0022B841A8|nr:hypothetical protein [Agrobacterium salinitolerans]MCZ7856001.1 hypothetical protein [Agrobacterium salinitolerans]